MADYIIHDTTLEALGDAIREKTGTTDTMSPAEMVEAIEGLISYEPDSVVFTGDASSVFKGGYFLFLLEDFPTKFTTNNLIDISYMFSECNITEVPFALNFQTDASSITLNTPFTGSTIQVLPEMIGCNALATTSFNSFGANLSSLIDATSLDDINLDNFHTSTVSQGSLFYNSPRLKNLPTTFLKNFYTSYASANANFYSVYRIFAKCYSLEEINDLALPNANFTTTVNHFQNSFDNCSVLSKLKFALDNNNNPQVRRWRSQIIDLSTVGYAVSNTDHISSTDYTENNRVVDNTSYINLKDTDYYTTDIAYSRYNHDSAIETILTLPDCSTGGANTIKFKSGAGSATEGGSISDLTAEEIAIATAKNWTVSLV